MKNIKGTIIVTVFGMLLIWMEPTLSIAEQRMITFEMGESGQSISFPMNQKEILTAEKTDKVIREIIQRKRSKQRRSSESFELAESGITINFPMSDEETSAAKSDYQKLVEHHEKMSDLQKEMEKSYEIFELGESGKTLRFKK